MVRNFRYALERFFKTVFQSDDITPVCVYLLLLIKIRKNILQYKYSCLAQHEPCVRQILLSVKWCWAILLEAKLLGTLPSEDCLTINLLECFACIMYERTGLYGCGRVFLFATKYLAGSYTPGKRF